MNTVGAIRKILLDEAMVTGLLADSTSIYPVILPQDKQYPAIALMVVDTKPNDSKTQVSGVDNVQVVANIFAKTYDRVQQIDTMVRNTIDGFSGGVTTSDATVHYIDAVRFLGRKDDFDEESILFVRQCIYDVRYFRDIPPLPFGTPYTTQSAAWIASLPVWNNDTEAAAGGIDQRGVTVAGLSLGSVYVTGSGCDFSAAGMLKIMLI